jgi:hypothetical protein
MNDIKIKILNVLRIPFSDVTYLPKIVNNYTNNKYFLVYIFKTPVLNPRNYEYTQTLEIEFASLAALNTYINGLDDLTNTDLIIQSAAPQQINNNINVDTRVLKVIQLSIAFVGQTTFFITENLTALDTLVYINGQKLKYVHDYYLTSNSIVFTNLDMLLSPSDSAEIYYLG